MLGRNLGVLVTTLVFSLCLVSTAVAGPGNVQVTTVGDIDIRLGAQVRFVPTSESNRDFGLSDNLSSAEETRAAAGMRSLGLDVFSDSTRSHLTETAGAVKDSYVRTEDRLFFNFSHGDDWDVYMALETDMPINRKGADRTDFVKGHQSQQFGIERLEASFNIPFLSSRLRAGWDARGVDIGFAGFVYADDDPGIGLVGGADNWKWALWWIKKDEKEAVYADLDPNTNAIGATDPGKDQDRDFYYGKLGYGFDKTFVEGFYMFNRNRLGGAEIDHHIVGVQAKGTYGIFMPMAEFAYAFGDWEKSGSEDKDIESWAFFGDVAMDLRKIVGIDKFEFHLGGYYVQGDDDVDDDDLEGFAPVVGISRFTPRFGSDSASIVHDGNPIYGQTLYSMFPAYYGRHSGAGINGGGNFDNPGLIMVGGGLKTAYGKWAFITNIMAMWFDDTEAIEFDYGDPNRGLGVAGTDIDEFMGVEWNNEVRYKPYKSVTLKGAAAFLFPGEGGEDITQALDAYAKGVDFDQGDSSDDVSMRFATEIIWFF
jgi:hypothetical protein